MNKALICYSGGAVGSDYIFGLNCEKFKIKYRHLYFENYKTPHGNYILPKNKFNEAFDIIKLLTNRGFRKTSKNNYINHLLARNYYQVHFSDSIYAVCYIDNNLNEYSDLYGQTILGGTGWAVEIAKMFKKPIYAFNQENLKWNIFNYDNKTFEIIDYIPVLTENFAGIGTREIASYGEKAIQDLFLNLTGGK